ncbi:MAG: hypothetical protein KAR42_10620 [candidate division Zixibacteria bacterium]|nr:hypothetical protein [candidate division Zixibacteria bacterium]
MKFDKIPVGFLAIPFIFLLTTAIMPVFKLFGWSTWESIFLAFLALFSVGLILVMINIGNHVVLKKKKTQNVRKMLLGFSFLGLIVWFFKVNLQNLKVFNIQAAGSDLPLSIILALIIGYHLFAFNVYIWREYFENRVTNKIEEENKSVNKEGSSKVDKDKKSEIEHDTNKKCTNSNNSILERVSASLERFVDLYLPPILGILAYSFMIVVSPINGEEKSTNYSFTSLVLFTEIESGIKSDEYLDEELLEYFNSGLTSQELIVSLYHENIIYSETHAMLIINIDAVNLDDDLLLLHGHTLLIHNIDIRGSDTYGKLTWDEHSSHIINSDDLQRAQEKMAFELISEFVTHYNQM